MQDLVRGLQSQSISGHSSWSQEQMRDSGTESDEEELVAMSERAREEEEDLFSIGDPPAFRSSPPQPDADSTDSLGGESGILSDVEEHFDDEPRGDDPPLRKRFAETDVTFPVMSMNDSPARNLRPRRCRVRVIVNRPRHSSESDMEIFIPPSISPINPKRAPKRPALDLDKMMRNRLDSSMSPQRKRTRANSQPQVQH